MTAAPIVRAVLWDMDGTLVNTEILWDKAIYSTMESLGAPLTPEQRATTLGLSMPDLLAALGSYARQHPQIASSLTPQEVEERIDEGVVDRMMNLYREGIKWCPGAYELLTNLKEHGIPQALVTNTQRRLTEVALETIGPDLFEATVCADDVEAGKPAPDPYRRATELLSVAPAESLVLEDSPTGVTAGYHAGCRVIGVSPTGILDHRSECSAVVKSLQHLDQEGLYRLLAEHME